MFMCFYLRWLEVKHILFTNLLTSKSFSNMANLTSIGVPFFKQQNGITTIEVLVSPTSQKLFCSTDTGMTFKCEQNLDVTKEMVILVDSTNPDDPQYTLINKRTAAEVKITL